jgi:hypothetical protein
MKLLKTQGKYFCKECKEELGIDKKYSKELEPTTKYLYALKMYKVHKTFCTKNKKLQNDDVTVQNSTQVTV